MWTKPKDPKIIKKVMSKDNPRNLKSLIKKSQSRRTLIKFVRLGFISGMSEKIIQIPQVLR